MRPGSGALMVTGPMLLASIALSRHFPHLATEGGSGDLW